MTQEEIYNLDDVFQYVADDLNIASPSSCRNIINQNCLEYTFDMPNSLSIVIREEVLERINDMGYRRNLKIGGNCIIITICR